MIFLKKAVCLFEFDTKHTCLSSLNSLKFLILRLTIAASLLFNLTLLLKKIGALVSCFVIKLTAFVEYFPSGLRILNMALLRSIVTTKLVMKFLPKLTDLVHLDSPLPDGLSIDCVPPHLMP